MTATPNYDVRYFLRQSFAKQCCWPPRPAPRILIVLYCRMSSLAAASPSHDCTCLARRESQASGAWPF
eukprot:scaffold24398_cov133-Isochrysis_galbana.AAC.4